MNMRNFYRNILLIIIFLSVSSSAIIPQEFKASVDKTKVEQYERFQVYFTFSGGDINKVTNFKGPNFKGFNVLSGPNQSTSMQIINNSVSSSIEYSYIIQSSQEGNFTIGSASLSYEGKKYSTGQVNIEVVKGTGKPDEGNTEGSVSQEELAKNVFIIATPDKRKVYLGEQLTVTYKLYTRLNISSPQISKLPVYSGFWAEDLESSRNINFAIEMYNGERYRAAIVKKVALFPTKPGELSITPFELNVPVLVKRKKNSRDFFDDFFNDSFFGRTETIEYAAKSNTLLIDVLPLPEGNVPSSYKGAVGEFDFKVELDKSNVKQNEAVSFKVTLSGKGNIKLLDLPEINLPPGFEKYEPKTSERISRNNIVSGSKTVEFIVVPRVPGVKIIPPIEFSYFSLNQKKYISLASEQFEINVEPGDDMYETGISGFSKENVKLLSQDIRFIKTSSFNLISKNDLRLVKDWFWITLFGPLVILLIAVVLKSRHDRLKGDINLMKFQKAEKMAKSRLKLAQKALTDNDMVRFYTQINQGLSDYLGDKLQIQKSRFTFESAVKELQDRSIDPEMIANVKDILEKSEFARFAPNADGGKQASEIYEKAINTITRLDKSITKKRK